MNLVTLYDTTLRDGVQSSAVAFTRIDKFKIIKSLVDDLAIEFIEIYPYSNVTDRELINDIKIKAPNYLENLVAFGSTRKVDVKPEQDENLLAIVNSGVKHATIFGKTWQFHLQFIKATPQQNLEMIEDSVRFLKANGLTVFYDAEHFFDGYKDNKKYAIQCLQAAEKGGADSLVLCDTNGGTMPGDIFDYMELILQETKKPLGIHAHNDTGMGVANSIAAVQVCLKYNRLCQVQGTMNGLGERAGNANLTSIIPVLDLKMKLNITPRQKLRNLTGVSNLIYELANIIPPLDNPFVGYNAFSHKGGMHIAAIERDYTAYEHIDPDTIGNHRRVVVSEMSGKSAILHKLKTLNIDIPKDSPIIEEILKIIKKKESHGYTYEGADASLEILIRGIIADPKLAATYYRRLYFDVEYFRVITDVRNVFLEEEIEIFTDANIKMTMSGKNEFHTAADGNGPVNALDRAFRKALLHYYPMIDEIELADFKVRIANAIEGDSGTASRVKVMVMSRDKDGQTWGTIGSHGNVIIASFLALLDSYIYKLMKDKIPPVKNGNGIH